MRLPDTYRSIGTRENTASMPGDVDSALGSDAADTGISAGSAVDGAPAVFVSFDFRFACTARAAPPSMVAALRDVLLAISPPLRVSFGSPTTAITATAT